MTLTVDGLTMAYGSRLVIDGVSFEVKDGEVLAVMGPNGVGKSTLVRGIVNMKTPQRGSAYIDGVDVRSFKPRDLAKNLAYVPQIARPSAMTVFDSVLIGRKPYIEWVVTEEDEEMVWKLLEMLSMEHLAMKYLDQLSGGQLQKVHIARAIVQDTNVIILDEPTNNLDIMNQHSILSMIRAIVKKKGSNAIVIMHDINSSLAYSDKFLFLEKGRIASYGGSETVTPEIIRKVYGVDSVVTELNGRRVVVPDRMEFELRRDGPDICAPPSRWEGRSSLLLG